MILPSYGAVLVFIVFITERPFQASPSPNENGEVNYILSTQATKYSERGTDEPGAQAGYASRS